MDYLATPAAAMLEQARTVIDGEASFEPVDAFSEANFVLVSTFLEANFELLRIAAVIRAVVDWSGGSSLEVLRDSVVEVGFARHPQPLAKQTRLFGAPDFCE